MGVFQSQVTEEDFQYNVPVSEGSNIRRNPKSLQSLLVKPSPEIDTLQDLWNVSVKKYPNNVCLAQRDPANNNEYRTRTYSEVNTIAHQLGSGVINLKLADTLKEYQNFELQLVGIYAKNREEWLMTDIGCGMMFGMTLIPIYDTLGPQNVSYCLNHTNLSVIFVDSGSLNTLLKNEDIGKVRHIVCFDPITEEQQQKSSARNLNLITFEDLKKAGANNLQNQKPVTPQTIFSFSYTSGTTGNPKAAMLSHRYFTAITASTINNPDINLSDQDVHLSYLPLPHIFDRGNCVSMLCAGGSIYFFNGDIMKLKQDLADVRPTLFASVPRLYNKFYDAIINGINNAPIVKKTLGNMAINQKLNAYRTNGTLTHPIWDKLVFGKIRDGLFGGRMRVMVTSSAPISKDVLDFFQIAVSCPMLEAYGQTEFGLYTLTYGQDKVSGHVGGCVLSVECKLDDIPEMNYKNSDKDEQGNPQPRGEICFRGEGKFSGYYKDEEKTREAVDEEGWVHTGDVGQFNHKDGHLKIIDRKKNIFKLSQGEYIAPEKIESYYLKTQGVAEVFVYGDSLQSHLVGIVVPEKPFVENLAKELGLGEDQTFEQLCQNIEIRKAFNKNIFAQGKNEKLFGFEQIRSVYLEPVSFAVHGCFTNTMKLQRHNAKEIFQKQIKQMYSEENLV